MKVSVVTVSYNSAATIEDTIRSVVSQHYPDLEYLIIDGASKDNTLEIASRYQDRIAAVVSERDRGIYDAMNKGVQMASGDVIGILNSDDFYADQDVIADVVRLFNEKQCDVVYADLDYVDQHDTTRVVRRWRAGQYRHGHFTKGWMPPHPTFFIRKELYQKFGAYNLELRSAADYELMLRMMHRHRASSAYLNRTIIHMRTGGQSNVSLRNRLRANAEDRRAWAMNNLRPAWYTLTWKPLRKIGQFVRLG